MDPEKMNRTAKLNGLDLLRAIAITLVFLFHYRLFRHPDWLDDVIKFGWTGVDLFFVLSGYLIADQLFRKAVNGQTIPLREFYLKRFFRIIPAFLAVLFIYFCFPFFREKEALPPLWRFLTFTQNFGLDPLRFGTFSHAWSLCIEEQFYFLLPLLLLLGGKLSGKKVFYTLAFLALAGLVIRILLWNGIAAASTEENFRLHWFTGMYYPTYTRLDGLLAGIGVAAIFNFAPGLREKIQKYSNLVLIAGSLLVAAAYLVCLDPVSFRASVWGFPLVAFSFGLIVAAVISPKCIVYKFRSRIVSGWAALSYAIYLVHKGTIHMTQVLLEDYEIDQDGVPMLFCCMLTTIAVALLLRYSIEIPFLKLRDRMVRKTDHGVHENPELKEQ